MSAPDTTPDLGRQRLTVSIEAFEYLDNLDRIYEGIRTDRARFGRLDRLLARLGVRSSRRGATAETARLALGRPDDDGAPVEVAVVSESDPSPRTRRAVRLALGAARFAPRPVAARCRRFALDCLVLAPSASAVAAWPDRVVSAALPSVLATAGLAPGPPSPAPPVAPAPAPR